MSVVEQSSVSHLSPEQQQAKRQVDRFVGRFQSTYRLLTYYAALPLVLTPELLHYLRTQFLQGEGVPWVAEVDLLLSDLCQPVGYEQYAMDTAVRAYLLQEMEQQLGQAQMVRTAKLLIRYVEQLERTNLYLSRQELEAQHLAALLVLDEERAVRQVTTAYLQATSGSSRDELSGASRAELARLSSLTQELAPQIKKYENLVKYAEVVGQLLTNPESANSSRLQQAFPILGDLELRVPDALVPGFPPSQPEGFPLLQTFEFEVATIVLRTRSATAFESLPNPFQLREIELEPFEFEVASIELQPVGEQRDPNTLSTQEIFERLDEAVFAQTGQHLTHVQLSVLEGTWGNKTYKKIAQKLGVSEGQVQSVASNLWQQLSQIVGQKISKSNAKTVVMQWIAGTGEWNLTVHRQQQQGWQFLEDLGATALRMVAISGGSFLMGSPEDELERSSSEGPQHTVTVRSFLMGKYPVNQAQWRVVAGLPQVNRELNPDPSRFKGENRPVECVSWYEAVEFCDRLSQKTGREYRLPSEAEWEYACRAGTSTPFHFGETITTDLANYRGIDHKEYKWSGSYGQGPKGIYREETTEVRSFPANAFGLYDMHGNVLEWCLDHWHDSYEGAPIDGNAWLSKKENTSRLLRGGSWNAYPGFCRSAYRGNGVPDGRFDGIGFRVVCSTLWEG